MFQYTAPSGITIHSVYPPQEVTIYDTNHLAFFVLSMKMRIQQIKKHRRYAKRALTRA